MRFIELQDLVKAIYKYFKNQKVPDAEVLELWTEQLKSVQTEGVNFILSYIKDNKNALPTNLPRVIDEGWMAYLHAHPEKFTSAEEVAGWDCPDCHGGGVLHCKFMDPKTKLKCIFIVICATCRQSHKRFGHILHEGGKIPRKNEAGNWIRDGMYVPPTLSLTKQEIIDKGWEFLEPENKYAPVLERIPENLKYAKLLGIKRDIISTHEKSLTDQAKGLVDNENFTEHEAARAVKQAVEIRVREARRADNPGDIIKQMFDI